MAMFIIAGDVTGAEFGETSIGDVATVKVV
jgi:hypothetical protein